MTSLALLLLLQIAPPAPAPVLGSVVADSVEAAAPTLAPRPAVETRPAPQPLLDELRADAAFQYDRPEAEQPSLWDRFMSWIGRTLLQPFGDGIVSRPVQVGLMALAAGVLLWVVFRFLQGEGSGLFGRRDVDLPDASDPLLDVDDIEAVDLGARLRDVLRDGDHRAAVRLRYLLVLQRLARDGHIAWARDKTNRTYVVEARASAGADVGRAAAAVTRVFDHVWYGGLAVDAARYDRFAAQFNRLDALLNAPRARRPVPA